MSGDFEFGVIVGGIVTTLASAALAFVMKRRAEGGSFWYQATKDDDE